MRRDREAEQTEYGEKDRDDHDPLCMESPDHPRTEQSGDDRHERDRHGNIARKGGGHPEAELHGRPSGTEKRVRKTETNENEIDNSQQQRTHGSYPPDTGLTTKIITHRMGLCIGLDSHYYSIYRVILSKQGDGNTRLYYVHRTGPMKKGGTDNLWDINPVVNDSEAYHSQPVLMP